MISQLMEEGVIIFEKNSFSIDQLEYIGVYRTPVLVGRKTDILTTKEIIDYFKHRGSK